MDVAAALDIHPFMLSPRRRQVRDGMIVAKGAKPDVKPRAELKRLKELERDDRVLKEEHELLKEAIRFLVYFVHRNLYLRRDRDHDQQFDVVIVAEKR
jgi:transposase-like protein